MTADKEASACLEKQLLVGCACTRITSEGARRIREILSQPLDWDYILRAAEEHSITPLLHRSLAGLVPYVPPPPVKERLTKAVRANTARSLYLTGQLIKILDAFQVHKVSVIPYKGPILAVQVYQNVSLRRFEDLDLIVRQRDLPKAHEIILTLGYKAKFDWVHSRGANASLVPAEYGYINETQRTLVELHTEVTLRHSPLKPDLDYFIRRLKPVRLGDRDVGTFPAEDLLPMLCIHGSKHFWDRISWIADVSELVQSPLMVDWGRSMRVAQSLNASRIVNVGLALAHQMLDTPLPREILTWIRADGVADEVATSILQRLISRDPQSLNATARFNLRRRMVAGFFDGWRYASRLAILPAEEDWEMVRLPPALVPLYIALRPLRLFRKYGWKPRQDAGPTI